jgi:hypothetical protein
MSAKVALTLSLTVALAGCNVFGSSQASDAQKRGADLIVANGCGTCHSIPGNAMPNTNGNDAQARDITAYLPELQ